MLNFIPNIGIMQGRLSYPINNKIQSFPDKTWKEEFKKAHDCGFKVIEWVFDDLENPVMKDSELNNIIDLSSKHNISINSLCADYFMKEKLFDVSDLELERNLLILKNLIIRCKKIGVKILEIPLVDSSSLKTQDNKDEFVKNLTSFLSDFKSEIIINLETDLPPIEFKKILEQFKDFQVFANYDTGNSASLGFSVNEELELLGPWIKNIHIKDRLYKGSTISLGDGDVDFELFFKNLSKIQYSGDLIIQGARNSSDNSSEPLAVCSYYYQFVNQYVDKYLR